MLRGQDLKFEEQSTVSYVEKKLYSKFKKVDWADDTSFTIDSYPSKAYYKDIKQTRSCTMILNSDLCLSPLESIHSKSILKYKAGAYLHWYKDVS